MNGLEIDGLSFGYRGRPVLRDISLRVEAGSFCALLGANGAGKTTLLKCINALLRPQAGRVCWQGRDTGRLSIREGEAGVVREVYRRFLQEGKGKNTHYCLPK